jgi:hypothetical protein
MADFVAVIRRAVDGLAKNTPDMRAKVYDKARGAVRRQLENMKPTPSDDLIRRQMDKLEAAIDSVEAEHAEALPAEEPLAAPVSVAPEVIEQETPSPEAPEAAEPKTMAPGWLHDRPGAAHATVEDGDREPVAEPSVPQEEHVSEPSEDVQSYEHGAVEHAAPVYPVHEEHLDQSGSVEHAWAPEQGPDEEPRHHDEYGGYVEHHEPLQSDTVGDPAIAEWPEAETHQPSEVGAYDADAADAVEHRGEQSDHVAAPYEQDVQEEQASSWHPEEQQPAPSDAAEAAATEDWAWPPEAQAANEAEAAWQDVPDLGSHQTDAVEDPQPLSPVEPVEAHFHEPTHVAVDSVRMPAVTELPDLAPATPTDYRAEAADEFDGIHRVTATPAEQAASKENDPWSDLEELIGYNRDALPAAAGAAAPLAAGENGDDEMLSPPPPTYRVAPKKRSYAGPILALIGLLIVAGGGYALWLNKDSLTELVGVSEPVVPATEPAADGEAANTTPPATTEQTPAAPQTETATGEPAAPSAEDGVAADAKFTQRLLPNGSEVDEGPGPVGATGEGQSVAQLNAPPAAAGEAGDAEAGAAGEAPATPGDAAALSGEKMFLYEERLGQTAPTAIEGAISWSLQREPGENGAQEPVVQGRLNVPGRGLTALLTFKRNTDASLPASHLVEIVFAVPPGFEGGAIDSVQRIAMKQTEQDRGDALIAVPAKITDDFHMIALNDFPDARATNLELLRSRNWMDIPLAYRNGRRALLTMQKGEAGMQAFNEAIQEWTALNGSSTPAPTGQ